MVQGSFISYCNNQFEGSTCEPDADRSLSVATAAQDSLSDEALLPLKTYKYSSVDKSYISNYILKHYVCVFPNSARNLKPRRED